MNKYLRSDMEEATRTRRWLLKQDMRREKRWIVDPDRKIRIPTAWYAISILAKRNGITCVSKHATLATNRKWVATVTAQIGHGKLAGRRVGASSWDDRRIALCFAYRNAIRQLLPQDPNERMAYRDTQDNALRKYA